MSQLNIDIFHYFSSFAHQSWFGDTVILFFGEYFPYFLIICLLFYVLFSKDQKNTAMNFGMVIFTAIIAFLIAEITKHFYFHPRPFEFFGFNPIIAESGNSFPSGHASFFSALAFALLPYSKKLASGFLVGAILIGIARVVAGIHWPFDILAGFIVGAVVSVVVYFLEKKFVKWAKS